MFNSFLGENNEKQFHGIKGYVVWAGLEPIAFKALFPDWSDRDDIKDINLQVNLKKCLYFQKISNTFISFLGWSHQ